jgi:hypothetical protein
VAEWLRSGLQSRLHRFDSGRRLSSTVCASIFNWPETHAYAHLCQAHGDDLAHLFEASLAFAAGRSSRAEPAVLRADAQPPDKARDVRAEAMPVEAHHSGAQAERVGSNPVASRQ